MSSCYGGKKEGESEGGWREEGGKEEGEKREGGGKGMRGTKRGIDREIENGKIMMQKMVGGE